METIMHHLGKIREQPEHVRRHILHISTVIVAVILFFLWVYSLGTTLTNEDTQAKINQDLKPFSAIKDNLTSGYNDQTMTDADLQKQLESL
jgi:hypothetical protein